MSVRERIRRLEQETAVLAAGGPAVAAVPTFLEFLQEVNPTWNWRWAHLTHLQAQLERVTSGALKRLMVCMPPRHGKSEMTTVRYAAYRLVLNPGLRIILGAHTQKLAEKFSRRIRKIVRERVRLNPERKAAADWEAFAGGGLRAVGVGVGIAGHGADLILVDDPIRNREEANSELCREKLWDWWLDDMRTRLEPGGAIVVIQTRWHEDDLAGRLLASETGRDWELVDLPALAETQEERDQWAEKIGRPKGQPDPLGRAPGQALCPERYDEKALAEIKSELLFGFASLFQGRPRPRAGAMFQPEWFRLLDVAPRDGTYMRYWDKAGTAGAGANTAGTLMCRTKARTYVVLDCTTRQLEAAEREELIKTTAELDKQEWGAGVKTWVEQEPGSGGKESAQGTVKNLAGHAVEADRVTGDKVLRAEPWAAQCKAGNVYLLKGPWNKAYIDEHCSFPLGKKKDRVDSSSGVFSKLALGFQSWSKYG